MKGHPQSNCGGGATAGGGGWMIKNKMVMVAVVILVGVIGVMVVQRVKDRRLFNLVIKDKDRQILSLNLLLQKEKQYAKENKRKNQDLNAKLFSLRTQKVELNNKIMEMRSIIGSMKDEQRALELAIDEKQNEIKYKEYQIKDLKINLQSPPITWSNHQLNSTTKVKETGSWFGHQEIIKPDAKVKETGSWFGHQEIIKPDAKVQKPKDEDSEKLAGSNAHNAIAKIEMHNTTNGRLATKEKWDSEEKGNGLTMKGRKFFIGATASQKDKSNGQDGKSKLKANPEEGPTEETRLKSNTTKGEANKTNQDEAETEADMNSSKNGSEEDQDYKEETEE